MHLNRSSAVCLCFSLTLVALRAQNGPIGPAGVDPPLAINSGWIQFGWPPGPPTPYNIEGPFTFASTVTTRLAIVDAFCKGDQFRVYDNSYPLGDTNPVPVDVNCANTATDPVAALADPAYSRAVFTLTPGYHSIVIQTIVNPFDGGGAFLRVDSLLQFTPVPPCRVFDSRGRASRRTVPPSRVDANHPSRDRVQYSGRNGRRKFNEPNGGAQSGDARLPNLVAIGPAASTGFDAELAGRFDIGERRDCTRRNRGFRGRLRDERCRSRARYQRVFSVAGGRDAAVLSDVALPGAGHARRRWTGTVVGRAA